MSRTDFWDSVIVFPQGGEGETVMHVTNHGNVQLFQVGMDVEKISFFRVLAFHMFEMFTPEVWKDFLLPILTQLVQMGGGKHST